MQKALTYYHVDMGLGLQVNVPLSVKYTDDICGTSQGIVTYVHYSFGVEKVPFFTFLTVTKCAIRFLNVSLQLLGTAQRRTYVCCKGAQN